MPIIIPRCSTCRTHLKRATCNVRVSMTQRWDKTRKKTPPNMDLWPWRISSVPRFRVKGLPLIAPSHLSLSEIPLLGQVPLRGDFFLSGSRNDALLYCHHNHFQSLAIIKHVSIEALDCALSGGGHELFHPFARARPLFPPDGLKSEAKWIDS